MAAGVGLYRSDSDGRWRTGSIGHLGNMFYLLKLHLGGLLFDVMAAQRQS